MFNLFGNAKKKELKSTLDQCRNILAQVNSLHTDISGKYVSVSENADTIVELMAEVKVETPEVKVEPPRAKVEPPITTLREKSSLEKFETLPNKRTKEAMTMLWKYGFKATEITDILKALGMVGVLGKSFTPGTVASYLTEIGVRTEGETRRHKGIWS